MSKYIIEIDDDLSFDVQFLQAIGAEPNGVVRIRHIEFEKLEELNSDYINEHFGDLQDEAYKRGFEDGKGTIHKGCEGCRYSGTPQGDSPCFSCSNYYSNNWQKQDDEINVGDEVDWSGDKFIVTRIFQPHNNAEECDGVDTDGCTYHDVLISGLTKTGRHVDITDMLKGALE